VGATCGYCTWVQRVVIVSIVTFPYYGLVMGGGFNEKWGGGGHVVCVC
jgi:hypothetical protein